MFPSEITELYHRYNGAANLRQAVVFFVLGGPLLVDLVRRQDGGDAGPAAHRMIPYFYNSTTVIPAPEANGDGAHEDARREGGAAAANKDRGAPEGSNAAATGCMDRSGRFAFVGSVKGELSVVDLDSLAVMDHIQCCETKLRIMHIHMSSRNDRILVNGYDRMLRVCSVDVEGMARAGGAGGRGLLTLVQTFKNSIENFAWGNCSFSHDCRYVIGSPTVKTGETHQLHVFNCSSGNFECVLEGPPESVTHIEYHPHSPIMLSLSSSGDVYVWAKNYTEKWSAFAPDFRELDENEEYVEREDEFDLAPHDPRERLRPVVGGGGDAADGARAGAGANGGHAPAPANGGAGGGDAGGEVDVDVTTVDRELEALDAFDLCGDCHEEPLRYLPITPGSTEIEVHEHQFAASAGKVAEADGPARASKKGDPSSSQPAAAAAEGRRGDGGAGKRDRRAGGGGDATAPAANDRKRRGDGQAADADGGAGGADPGGAGAKKKAKKRR